MSTSTATESQGATSTSIRADKEGFLDKAQRFGARFRPNRHNAMPTFRNQILVMIVTGLIVLVGATTAAFQAKRAHLGDTALYTTQFTTSKTGQSGQVAGVFTNADHTRAMLLMKFDDISKMSTDAKQYQAWVAGSNASANYSHLKSHPSGAVYMFGSTGYMGVYLTDAVGFPNQVISVSMRAHTELVAPGDNGASGSDFDDSSFAKYDQWRMFINPGARGATRVAELDQAQPDLQKLYDQMVVQPQEADARASLDKDLATLKADLASISEYSNRLSTMQVNGKHLVMEPLPVQIRSDQVTGDADNLVLKTSHVVPGGFDFDWRSGSVQQGYLSKIVPSGAQWDAYLSAQAAKAGAGGSLDVGDDATWALSDGSLLSDYAQSAVAPYQTMTDTINLLQTAEQTYYRDKQTYEVTDLSKLLNLEVGLKDVRENNTINSGTDAIKLY